MRSRIKVITLGVSDLERALAFYRDGMGLPTQGIIGMEFEDGAVVFFEMNDDLILALYPRTALAKDAKVSDGPGGPADLSIGHIVGSKEEVDAIMKQAKQAGATITDPAAEPEAELASGAGRCPHSRPGGDLLDDLLTHGSSLGHERPPLRAMVAPIWSMP